MTMKEKMAATNVEEPAINLLLHQYPRSSAGPNLSPFALKLESYLRLTKTEYKPDFNKPNSTTTGKCPWISYGGQEVSDSSMCIEFLKTKTGVDLNSHLSETDWAVSRAFQKLIEDELCWVLALWRWVYDKDEVIQKLTVATVGKVKGFVYAKFARQAVKKHAHGHGIGRNTPAEVLKMGEDDVKAVGQFLGSKKYFMGDLPSDIDCSVFGVFAQLLYVSPTCPLTSYVKEHFSNIVDYCDRLKAEVWPDWEELCLAAKVEKKKEKVITEVSNTSAAVFNGNGTLNGHHEEAVEQNGHGEAHLVNGETPLLNGGGASVNPCTNGDGDEVVKETCVTQIVELKPEEAQEVVMHKNENGGTHGLAVPAV